MSKMKSNIRINKIKASVLRSVLFLFSISFVISFSVNSSKGAGYTNNGYDDDTSRYVKPKKDSIIMTKPKKDSVIMIKVKRNPQEPMIQPCYGVPRPNKIKL